MSLLHPNNLSWARIAAVPLVVLLYLAAGPLSLAALILYILAAVTDVFDGMLARAANQQTRFGVFIDPVADKLLVVTMLVMLLATPSSHVPQPLLGLLAALVILREVIMSALRDWMSQAGRGDEVAVTGLAKAKTITQMVGIGFLLGVELHVWLHGIKLLLWYPIAATAAIGLGLLGFSVVLGLITLARYLRVAFARGARD